MRAVAALASSPHLKPDAAGELFERLVDMAGDAEQSAFPWRDRDRDRLASADRLIEEYKKVYGDPNDPTVAAKLEADRQAEQARRAKSKSERDQTARAQVELERRLRERGRTKRR